MLPWSCVVARRWRWPTLRRLAALQLPGAGAGAHPVGVVADAVGDAARHHPAVAQGQRHRVRRLAGRDPGGALHVAPADADGEHVARGDALARRQGGRHVHRVLPHQLGERLGQLLQPGVGRRRPVPHAGVRPEQHGERPVRGGGRVRPGRGRRRRRSRRGVGGAEGPRRPRASSRRGSRAAAGVAPAAAATSVAVTAGRALFSRNPSSSTRRQAVSGAGLPARPPGPDRAPPVRGSVAGRPCSAQCARRMSSPGRGWSSNISDRISGTERPPYSGATVGCSSPTVPSTERTSPQRSSGCDSGRCQSERAPVSSLYSPAEILSGTRAIASPKPRSAGAS